MTQPTPYRRGYDFSDAGGAQPPGGPLDVELDALARTTRDTLRNLALIQRDDAALRNGIVGIDALDSRVLGLISGGTFSIAGAWATATTYPAGAFLTDDGAIYLVMEAHTSTSIVDDLAAGRIAKALQNEQGSRLRDDFTGNAVQTAYSLSQSPARPTDVEVYVNGALVLPDDYVQTGATVTFDVAPVNGAKISIFSITWATAPPIQTLVDAVGDRNIEISAATDFLQNASSNGGVAFVDDLAGPTGGEMVHFKRSVPFSREQTASEVLAEQLLTPETFRQPGDTVLLRLQRFLDALGNGQYGRLDADYVIPSQLVLTDRERFKLYGNGYTIKLANGAATGYGGSAIYIARCQNFEISDLIFDGNRANRVVAEDPAHVVVIDKCNDWKFSRVQANNGTSDGFFIGAGAGGSGVGGAVTLADVPQRWVMEDCVALGNYRQGCSVIEGIRGTFRRGRYGQTSGLWDAAGSTGPCAGIDLEPDNQPTWDQGRIQQILIDDVLFDQNQGAGLLISNVNGVKNIRVRDCIFDRNKKAAIESFGDQVDIRNITVIGWDQVDFTVRGDAPNKRGAIDIGAGAGQHRIAGVSLQSVTNGASSANPCIFVHNTAAAMIDISGVSSDGSASIILQGASPHLRVHDNAIDLTGAVRVDAFTLSGNYPLFTRNTLIGVYQRAVYTDAVRPRVIDNQFYVRVADHTSYVVGANDATKPEVRFNRIEYDVAVATYGIGVAVSAIVTDNWDVNNLSTDAFVFDGAPLIKRGNIQNTNVSPETAIVP